MPLPYVITILVTDGEPEGVRVVEKSNWTGRGLVFSRADLARALEEDLSSPGVYVLIGDDPDEKFEDQIYIGQGEDVGKRLKQHQGDDAKEFWNDTVVFVSGNESLNRAHISHLESELIRLAGRAKQSRVANGNQPAVPRMAPGDVAVADGFLAEMLAIFPVLAVTSFDQPAVRVTTTDGTDPAAGATTVTDVAAVDPPTLTALTRRRYFLTGPEAAGEGEERSNGFLVFAGARARITAVPSMQVGFTRLRERLVTSGALVQDGSTYRLTEDTLFSSPSAAGAALLGRSANGREEWKDADGVTLKQHQSEDAARAEAAS